MSSDSGRRHDASVMLVAVGWKVEFHKDARDCFSTARVETTSDCEMAVF
jgi:hypothetical protein